MIGVIAVKLPRDIGVGSLCMVQAWLVAVCLAVTPRPAAYADTLTSLLTRVLNGDYDMEFEQRFIDASDRFERREYVEAADLFRTLFRDGKGERDRELLRGYANASYYGARRNRDGLDFLCEISAGGELRPPEWLIHDAHAHIRAVAMRDGFVSGAELAEHYRGNCGNSAFSPVWIGVPLVKMEMLRAGIFVLDEAYRLDYSDEQLLGYVLRTYPDDPYADYARYFLHDFDTVVDAELRALIDHRPAPSDDTDVEYPLENADPTADSLARVPVGELISTLSGDRTTEESAAFLRDVMEALFKAERYVDLERILRQTPPEISAAVFANPGSRYHDILYELKARTVVATELSHADAERLRAIAGRNTCGNASDCIFYATTVPGSKKAQRSIEVFLSTGDALDIAAFRQAIDAGKITDITIAHLVERQEKRLRAAEIQRAVEQEFASCRCSKKQFIEARGYNARYVRIFLDYFDLEYDVQITDGPHGREQWLRLASLVNDPKSRRYSEQIVSRSHDFKTGLIERVASLLEENDRDGLLAYAIEVRGHCNNPHPAGWRIGSCHGYPQAASSMFRMIANEYPDTSAGEKALFLYAQLRRTRLGWGGHDELREFIDAYPESTLIDDALLELVLLEGPDNDEQRFVAELKSIASTYAEQNAADNALFALAEYYKDRGNLPAAARYYGEVGTRYAAGRLGRAAMPKIDKMRRAWAGFTSRNRIKGISFYGTYIEQIGSDADVMAEIPLEPYDQLVEFSGAPIEDDLDILAAFSDITTGGSVDLVFERLEWDEDTGEDVTLKLRARATIGQVEWFNVVRVQSDDYLMLRPRPHFQSEPSEKVAHDETCLRYGGEQRTLNSGAVWFKVRAATTTSASSTGWVNARFLEDAPECPGG